MFEKKDQYVYKKAELKIKQMNEKCNEKISLEIICGGDCKVPYMKIIGTNADEFHKAVLIKCMSEIAKEMIEEEPSLMLAIKKIHFAGKQKHTKRVID